MDQKTPQEMHVILLGECPECDAEIQFDTRPKVGTRRVCPKCRTPLEVVDEDPIRLDWAFVLLEDVVKPPTS